MGCDRKENNNPEDPLQYRDDVGFINHIETLVAEESVPSIEKVVVGGTSNGGLMTQARRLPCWGPKISRTKYDYLADD